MPSDPFCLIPPTNASSRWQVRNPPWKIGHLFEPKWFAAKVLEQVAVAQRGNSELPTTDNDVASMPNQLDATGRCKLQGHGDSGARAWATATLVDGSGVAKSKPRAFAQRPDDSTAVESLDDTA
jgi:hypothetical protein